MSEYFNKFCCEKLFLKTRRNDKNVKITNYKTNRVLIDFQIVSTT